METGFIYVVQMGEHPTYKIGYSADVPRRMSEIGVQLPFPYHLQFALRVNNPRRIETNIHREYREVRQNGEWFKLCPSQVEEIRLTLLLLQTYHLTERVVAAFKSEKDSVPRRFEKYGKVLVGLAQRLNRRADAMTAAKAAHEPEEILDAEYVA